MRTVLGQKQLRKLKDEFQELLGMLSIEELTTNRRFTQRYEKLHYELMTAF